MRPRALRRSLVTMAGGGGAGLGGGASGAGAFFAVGFGAGFFFGPGALRLGPASFSSEMVGSAPPLRARGSSRLSNTLRRYPWFTSLPWLKKPAMRSLIWAAVRVGFLR